MTISDADRIAAFFEARKSELQRRHTYYVRAYLKLGAGAEGSLLEYGRAQGLESAMDALGIEFQPIHKTDNPST